MTATTVPATAKVHLAPTRIAPDTFVIHDHQIDVAEPVAVSLNSMVIRGAEPVVVDTGMAENRDRWLADVFSLVEPTDIRWVFVSHDDVDHTGNVNAIMDLAPNATLVCTWFVPERMGASLAVPLTRQRWVDHGGRFDVGDRVLHAVRPPVFDSPTTRGLFDPTTGVYWSSDSFASLMPEPVRDVDELDPGFWLGTMDAVHQAVSPWLALVDDAKFQATVDRIAALAPSAMAGCHSPVIRGTRVADAIAAIRRAPTAECPPEPDQAVLERVCAALLTPAE
jgi:flavorubredoxin